MSLVPRILIIAICAILSFFLFREARAAYGQENLDPGKIVLLFGGVIVLGGAIAVLFVTLVMPSIGDAIGNLFFSPSEAAEKDPHADARTALAKGDFEEAIEQFKKAFENDETDTFALSEVAKIQCDHLQDPPSAAEFLEGMLQREWPPEAAVFLSSRLVDVYWKYQHDAESARALLLQIIEMMPGTKFAANAQHRLREIEQQLAAEG